MKGAIAAAAAFFLGTAAFAAPGEDRQIDFSGSVDTLLSGRIAADGAESDEGDFSYGFEEYANLRIKARVGERGTFYGAANLIAAAGSLVRESEAAEAADLFDSPLIVGRNYAAAVEPERLYIRVEGDAFDYETGLMRLAFGYGQAWSPSDFLSPRNPLLPDARPRGVLAIAATAYPTDAWKIKTFAVAGEDPEKDDAAGSVLGAAADLHTDRASFQALYAWEAAAADADAHRFGLSVKADAEVGIALDALYTIESPRGGPEGLGASLGIDYSFLDGDLYALAQYLYNGGSLRSFDLRQTNYLYGMLAYSVSDYTLATLDCALSLDDGSFQPSLTVAHEPFQGLSLSLSCRAPLDAGVFSGGGAEGEFGPEASLSRILVTAKAKAKF